MPCIRMAILEMESVFAGNSAAQQPQHDHSQVLGLPLAQVPAQQGQQGVRALSNPGWPML